MAKVIQVIETQDRCGTGVDGDPFRLVYQLWTLDGTLIFERDPWEECKAHVKREDQR